MYDARLVGALTSAGFPDPWVGQLLKGQALQEAGSIAPSSSNGKGSDECGGQNCGMWAISAGADSLVIPWREACAASPPKTH